jgi:hypothetical protein
MYLRNVIYYTVFSRLIKTKHFGKKVIITLF